MTDDLTDKRRLSISVPVVGSTVTLRSAEDAPPREDEPLVLRRSSDDLTDKRRHVASARQSRPHTCHWPGCTRQVPPALWGCSFHWFRLPAVLRAKVWGAYRIGQEETMTSSDEYLSVMVEVERWIAEHSRKGSP